MNGLLQRALRRDRLVVGAALVTLVALAWVYLWALAADMSMAPGSMNGMRMVPNGLGWMVPAAAPWSVGEFVLVLLMWAVMMIGMMTPSAAPMILIYARIGRQAALERAPFAAAGWFASGYLLVWTGFSLAASAAQWALQRTALLDPSMELADRRFGAAVLIAAGAWQWTPVKQACLSHCRNPLAFVQQHGGFRGTPAAALGLGVRHGAYCLGCCWVLMLLLFAGGIMNVLWIAGLSVLVLVEKLTAQGRTMARAAGLLLVLWGLGSLFA